MKLKIDREVDVVCVRFTNALVEESDEIKPGIICDYDANGKLVGIEFLDATELFGDLDKLASVVPNKPMPAKRSNTPAPRKPKILAGA